MLPVAGSQIKLTHGLRTGWTLRFYLDECLYFDCRTRSDTFRVYTTVEEIFRVDYVNVIVRIIV